MDIKLDIKPEQIEKAVTEAIIKSSIGSQITAAIQKTLNDWKFSSAIEAAVKDHIFSIVREMLYKDEELAAKIKKAFTDKLDDTFINSVADKLIRAAQSRPLLKLN